MHLRAFLLTACLLLLPALVSAQDEPASARTYAYTFVNEGGDDAEGIARLDSFIQQRLRDARLLADGKGDGRVEVTVTHYYARSDGARAWAGIMAGRDKVASRVGVVNNAAEYTVAERFRKQLNTKAPSVDVGVGTLSGGNQQKVVLAKWMFTDPDVLILDEPTRGIDVGAKYEIYTHIHALADAGKGMIVISSELPELLGICDRIYTLSYGRITGVVDRADATQELLMTYMTMEKDGPAA